jgi:hypothetical protein
MTDINTQIILSVYQIPILLQFRTNFVNYNSGAFNNIMAWRRCPQQRETLGVDFDTGMVMNLGTSNVYGNVNCQRQCLPQRPTFIQQQQQQQGCGCGCCPAPAAEGSSNNCSCPTNSDGFCDCAPAGQAGDFRNNFNPGGASKECPQCNCGICRTCRMYSYVKSISSRRPPAPQQRSMKPNPVVVEQRASQKLHRRRLMNKEDCCDDMSTPG